ncbi:Karyogamy protein KAR9 [Penicillium cf. griseofulvum]|uniref:Karyogamy protein KAR9 n=1 Tax=Penicillium cf. griseofulvum TaxID=2972120 RepID=A0A9W9J423_9EURO|nr:Karyogamy protein KAR9 [Penicillium cf. griseofulvum]KAJ5435030.1 Karyogamy protein KAR9 [Penicillium cf. griseofulvum]
MHATAESPTFATDLATHPPNISATPASPPSLTPALSVSPNGSGTSTLRRLKSKSSLWSLGSSNNEEEPVPAEPTSAGRTSILRRLSPALAARVKLLDSSNKSAAQNRHANAVGRIPEEHLKELDNLHQDLSIRVKRKGQAWNGAISPGETQEFKRSASNQLELPHQDILREIADAQRESPDSSEAVVDGPELSTPATTVVPVTAQPVENISPPTPMSVAEPVLAQPRVAPMSKPQGPNNAQDDRTDFQKYVDDTARREEQSAEEESAPKPPPKDSPPADAVHSRSSSTSNSQSYFNPMGLQRADSIYSFSRASFSNQLSQLTSIPLPQPASLEASIENISTALSAVRALNGAAEQIHIWIKKASDVLSGLDSEDDVEWAAAGGREGLDEVDKAITRFESLVNVYVRAIENVQHRDDIANVDADNLNTIVSQMESILENWTQIKKKLRGVKEQVELAMEWEELWSNVLGDVGVEVDNLSALIFEMEEKRHQALMDTGETSGGLDINELETIVEETPSKGRGYTQKRLSIGPLLASASTTPVIKTPQDDTSHSNLMAIFARMQPLRASLEFLPMRLSMFQSRAETIFPSACEEIEDRRNRLLKSYEVLETDAEALLKELAEDKWILVFRNAGAQAQKMFQSVERSIGKLQEGLESGMQLHNPSTLAKLIESFEQKKMHYVPAIERVVSIIQKGVNDRLTVNGEILRLLSDMTSRMDALKASIRVMDTSLEDVHITKGHQLRDSISSIMTMDSPITGSAIETPGSSPASSVIITGNGYKRASTPLGGSSRRGSSAGSATARSTIPPNRRYSSLPQPSATYTTRKSAIPQPTGLVSPTPSYRSTSYFTPTPGTRSRTPAPSSTIPNRPRWTNSTNLNDMSANNSTLRKSSTPLARTPRPSSTIPFPGSFRRDTSASPIPGGLRSTSRISSRFGSRSPSRNVSSPTPARPSLLDPPPYSRLHRPPGMSSTPRSRQSFAGPPTAFSRSVGNKDGMESPSKSSRPGTSLGHSSNRRTSLLPVPRREKEPATPKPVDTRPRWR